MVLVQALSIALAIGASLIGVYYKPLASRLEVTGVTREFSSIQNIHGEDFQLIEGTLYTEDLHYHVSSGLLFGASEANERTRAKWFPPVARLDPSELDQGTIIVIDPKTKSSKRLSLTNFSGPFITHGIDIWSTKNDPESVYIFAVNHLPNPAFIASNGTIEPAARSQIELFHHKLGTSTAKHLRSIWHPLIRTPNDIYAKHLNAIYVTNDHHYRKGPLRSVEDFYLDATWSDVIYIEIADINAKDATAGFRAKVSNKGIQNPNGFGHGRHNAEVLINRAAAGIMEIANYDPHHPKLVINQTVRVPTTVDNPSYFTDPYAEETGRDASGYVLAGLARAAKFPSGHDPVSVWLVQPGGKTTAPETWSRKLIFQDDGKTFSTAATGVLVAIDPKENGGRKQAWLFVAGPMARDVAATKVDL